MKILVHVISNSFVNSIQLWPASRIIEEMPVTAKVTVAIRC